MSKTLYLECASGISGDMFVAAMLDLGASEQKLRAALASLPIEGFEIEISRASKAGLDCCDFNVVLDSAHDGHDHDMEYLHGHEHVHEHEHAHEGAHHDHAAHVHEEAPVMQEHAHGHGHPEGHEHEGHGHEGHEHAHAHEHRGLPEIEAIIDAANITDGARDLAKRIFDYIARAEAKAHGVACDQVHFHEVGAVDSIVDVVAAAVCFDDLDISTCIVERLCEGRGTVRCQHGVLPVPVPATANICAQAGLPLSIVDVEGELVTPTGAAIAAAVRTASKLPERFTVVAMGLGAGKRSYSRPSLLRAMIVEPADARATLHDAPHMWKLETEMDDCSGEALGFLLDELKAAGAFEVHYLPVFMKKNRPGYQIQALCKEPSIPAVEAALFAHSTTIGVRRSPLWRTALEREIRQLETPYGPARAKFVTLPDGALRGYPEHDDVAKLAREANAGYQDVARAVLAAIDAELR